MSITFSSFRPDFVSNVAEVLFASPLWEDSEKQQPPCDYRELTEMPLKKDIYNAEPSYLRRAIIDGMYNDAAHYLDIMYRLFREDLISPLRDGIAVYKRTGATRYQKLSEDFDEVTSDLLIFKIEGLEGLQVRTIDGTLCRFARLTEESRSHPALSRNLIFGQVVCLSSDGFQEDYQLAQIVERDKTEEDGTIAFTFMDEDGTIVKDRSYQIADPQSYFIAYRYVLVALKSFTPYSPIPFERYIVYGKCDVRKPFYMRIDENVEDIVEDLEIRKYYENIRQGARAKIAKSKTAYDSDLEEELDTSLTKKKVGVINAYELERVKIEGKIYELDKLDEEYKPSTLDNSQRNALIKAITNEIAIIQGPPGTGKTFIGAEIASVILQNRSRWGITEPMLVIAFTNSAVDQFVEKVLEKMYSDFDRGHFCHEGPLIARLGSKSESDILKRGGFLKNDLVNIYSHDINTDGTIKELNNSFKSKRNTQLILAEASLVLYIYKRNLIGYKALTKGRIVPDRFKVELSIWKNTHCDSSGCGLDDDEAFACWLLDKSYNRGDNKMDAPPDDDEDGSDTDFTSQDLDVDESEEAVSLDKLLEDVNQLAIDVEEDLDELYLSDRKWDIVRHCPAESNVVLLGSKYKTTTKGKKFGVQKLLDRVLVSECADAKESILKVKPMEAKDVENMNSFFSLTKQRRWELYMYWMKQLRHTTEQQLPLLIENYRVACENAKNAQFWRDVEVLRKCLVICATTTGAAKEKELLEKIRCRVLIVDEAAEVFEAHVLASLVPSVEHMVLIGDHQQLRPNPSVYELAREYHLDVSLFERLVRNGFPYSTLQVQHRMNSDITRNIIQPYFYPEIIDDTSVLDYPFVPGMEKRCFFWMHEEPETTAPDAVSRSNDHEVKMIVGLISYLKMQGIDFSEITVIAAYSAQMAALRESVGNVFGRPSDDRTVVAVETVDSYQGKENRIIIVSLVRSERDGIGFLAVKNRITVALTRARHGMYVIGNFGYLSQCSSFWNKICTRMFENGLISPTLTIKCQRHGNVQEIEDPREFAEKSPEGGCQDICGASLPCGHSCPRRCHPFDDHLTYICLQSCLKRCKENRYRHPCQRLCSEECGACMRVVSVALDCGHLTNVVCSALSTAVCGERCEKMLKCGHQCSNGCGKPCANVCREPVELSNKICGHTWKIPCDEAKITQACPMPCQEVLPCGHKCADRCGQPCTVDCRKKVRRDLKCGHSIIVACCEDESEKQCQVLMIRELDRCGHSVMIPCHAGTDSSYCSAVCGKNLTCGHKCMKNCGECFVAGGCKCESTCGKVMSCGHRCSKKCGVPCEPCLALCLSRCKHQECGNSGNEQAIRYGRKCAQTCVLCPRLCDNSCQHRSCGKRCYEVCDVKPCEQPCTLQLVCGHACLGMCNEECPRLCGTCQRKNYVFLINQYLGPLEALTKLARIIEVEGCHHIFPVKYLDKHIAATQDQCNVPLCPYPECCQPIVRTHRYSKLVKKRNLEKYNQRIESAVTVPEVTKKVKMTEFWTTIKKELTDCEKLRKARSTKKKFQKKNELVANVLDTIADAERFLAVERVTRTDLYIFWSDYTKFIVLLSRLLQSLVKVTKFARAKKRTPIIRNLCSEILRKKSVQQVFDDEIRMLWSWLSNYGKTRLSGAVVPRARFLAVRCMFLNDLMVFANICNREARDLPGASAAESIRASSLKFLSATSEEDYLELFDEFEKVIIATMKNIGLDGEMQTRAQLGLNLPEF
ncbi:hypothetical protein RB195_008690 [Necator americanus]|uniref:NF-X1-type domain-containing protein n=1 Tax=Necator americanus TaxID=51031 RepID=A0ABR1CPU9_NECAM